MDSQHRHELQDNVLAGWLERQIESLKPNLPLILFGVVAAGVAVWALGLYRSSSESARYSSWDGFAIAMQRAQPDLLMLDQVAEDHVGTASAEWAAITNADAKLFAAAQTYVANRTAANDNLEKSKAGYQQLRGSADGLIRNRAVFGLARVSELQGDLEEAGKLYGQVTGSLGKVAEARAEELATNKTKADYAWLVTAAPRLGRPATRPAADPIPQSPIPDFTVDPIATPADTPAGGE